EPVELPGAADRGDGHGQRAHVGTGGGQVSRSPRLQGGHLGPGCVPAGLEFAQEVRQARRGRQGQPVLRQLGLIPRQVAVLRPQRSVVLSRYGLPCPGIRPNASTYAASAPLLGPTPAMVLVPTRFGLPAAAPAWTVAPAAPG